MSVRRIALVVVLVVVVACSGGGPRPPRANGGGRDGDRAAAADPAAAVKTRHLDEPGLLVADRVIVTILPAVLVRETSIEALHRASRLEGGHRVLVATGRARVKIRQLEIHAESFEAHVIEGEPVEGLRVLATGSARFFSEAAASPEEPQKTIVLQPEQILYGLD